MKLSNFAGLSLAALGLFVMASGANAQIYGTFGFVPVGTLTANSSALNNATSITVPALEIVNTADTTYLGHTNAFAGLLGSTITLSTTTMSNSPATNLGITFTANAITYTFTPTTSVHLVGSTGTAGNFLTFSEDGTLSAASFTSQNAQLAGSFSQTGNGGTVNGNFTFSTPPPTSTPEPGAVAMLIGVGVSGSAFAFRRLRRSK